MTSRTIAAISVVPFARIAAKAACGSARDRRVGNYPDRRHWYPVVCGDLSNNMRLDVYRNGAGSRVEFLLGLRMGDWCGDACQGAINRVWNGAPELLRPFFVGSRADRSGNDR